MSNDALNNGEQDVETVERPAQITAESLAQYVDATAFRELLVARDRRMERADKLAPKMKGLRDLETGEVFLTEERWLLQH